MDCELLEFSGESDHVHLLVDFHPKNSISAVAGCLKAATPRAMKRTFFAEVRKFYWGTTSFWSKSYYVANSSGAPIEKLRQYINSQDKPKA